MKYKKNPLTNADALTDEVSGRLIELLGRSADAEILLNAFFVLKKNLLGDKSGKLHDYLELCKECLTIFEIEAAAKKV